ncbi:hypothetical protein [Chromohalobacter moromii]|uniref:Uncharacterized protein n=1 Tax=Chromohalobacter moromii TaxID=2860329 RepID=A0A9X3AYJ9_9GAMM|nr:hypothetical protein [Chromohalobacter moromii]MCK2047059.1 hypothetical protein [Chromohalobacter moromii]MCT8506636.1 hypothetical protein [Chromohalobacter moromii]
MDNACAPTISTSTSSEVTTVVRHGRSGREEMNARGLALKDQTEKQLRYMDSLSRDRWPFGPAFELGEAPATGDPIDQTYPIDEMPCLKRRLGRGRSAKIRAGHIDSQEGERLDKSNTSDTPKRSNREKRIENTVQDAMKERAVGDIGCPASDVIAGIANLDHHSQKERNLPLNKISLYVILQELEVISTRNVKGLLDVGHRQAQKYVKACGIALPFLERALPTPSTAEASDQGWPSDDADVTRQDRLDAWIMGGA